MKKIIFILIGSLLCFKGLGAESTDSVFVEQKERFDVLKKIRKQPKDIMSNDIRVLLKGLNVRKTLLPNGVTLRETALDDHRAYLYKVRAAFPIEKLNEADFDVVMVSHKSPLLSPQGEVQYAIQLIHKGDTEIENNKFDFFITYIKNEEFVKKLHQPGGLSALRVGSGRSESPKKSNSDQDFVRRFPERQSGTFHQALDEQKAQKEEEERAISLLIDALSPIDSKQQVVKEQYMTTHSRLQDLDFQKEESSGSPRTDSIPIAQSKTSHRERTPFTRTRKSSSAEDAPKVASAADASSSDPSSSSSSPPRTSEMQKK